MEVTVQPELDFAGAGERAPRAPSAPPEPVPSPPALAGPPEFTVRRSSRARRLRICVDQNGKVEVVLPLRAPMRAVAPFVADHAEWIRSTQARFAAMRQDRARSGPAGERLVPYRGRSLPLRIVPTDADRTTLQYREDHFLVRTAPGSTCDDVKGLLEMWFRQVARPLFEERVAQLNRRTCYAWKRIRIGEQKTRWGSCSTSGTLSFNWRLLMAPPDVLDYVVLHELAHLGEPNHSPRFWALVEAACPNYKEHVRWLKQNGPALSL